MFNFSKTTWLIIVLAIVFIILAVLAWNPKANAWYQPVVCNADHHMNCVTPTPTEPCLQEGDEDVQVACPTPTLTPTPTEVTPTPSATPSATPVPQNGSTGSTGGGNVQSNNPPPVAQCGTQFAIPSIVAFTDKGNGTVNFAWTEAQTVGKYSITYGYTADNLNMGQDNIPGNVLNWDIHDLAPGSHVWAQVQAWFNGCEESSNVFDPIVK